MRVLLLISLLFSLFFISGCDSGGDIYVVNNIVSGNSSLVSGGNDTLIYSNECLDVICNTFIEVASNG